jgi:hypothetical protein
MFIRFQSGPWGIFCGARPHRLGERPQEQIQPQ